MDEDFQIFTTIRYDPQLKQVPNESSLQHAGWNFANASPLYMLDFHRDRLLKAAQHWNWQPAVKLLSSSDALNQLERLALDHLGSGTRDPARVQILVSSQGHVTVQSGITKPKALENLFPTQLPPPGEPHTSSVFALVLDHVPTAPSALTNYKTTSRPMYDTARQRASIGLGESKEVLVVNEKNGHIMEGTIFTPYFWRNGQWVTPPVPAQFNLGTGSGGQDGTTRRWALEQ
ncbi:amino-transferase class IV domain-containing protein [Sarocladium implicatum]|jgi:branched-subunit amino acid aminotransferase/4-amino-4-deoxychorismate lyase|nr:amino-transferase class IV domain-containing protein [Sarocladium implicatum]